MVVAAGIPERELPMPAPLETKVRRLHQQGVAATGDGRPAQGAQHLRAGLALLGWAEQDPPQPPGDPARDALVARLLISLAYAEAEQGRTRYGFELLDTAVPLVDPEENGILLQQRALMLFRIGQFGPALEYFDQAIPQLAAAKQERVLCPTLLNRAALYLRASRVRAAREDLAQCEALAQRIGLDVIAAKALHNRGLCDLFAGDLPQALAAFDSAEALYRQHSPGFLPVLTAAKARALLAAGLAAEAGRQLDEALVAFRRQRLDQEHAGAELLRAEAALRTGDYPAAAGWARKAERRLRRRGNDATAEVAALARLRAGLPDLLRPQGGVRPRAFAGRAARLAARLREVGLAQDAEMADLLAVRALAADSSRAALGAAVPVGRSNAPLELVLMRRLARAELATAQGRSGQAMAELRAGLSTLQERRSRLGSLDLQASITGLGRELAQAGLETAFEQGRPAVVFAWSERSRAQAFRVPPVHAPTDPVIAEALAELRQLRDAMRTAELEGRRLTGAKARCAELERTIQERTWRVAGPGHSAPAASLPEITAELTRGDRVMVSFLTRGGRLHALIVHNGAVRMVALGSHSAIDETARRLLADLDAMAGRSLPAPMREVVVGSVRRQLDVLATEVMAGLRAAIGDHELVIVPTMSLSSLPWSLLPDLRGRPVTVSASASAWLNARRAPPSRPRAGARPLLVAGPDLVHAEAEIDEIAKAYRGSRALSGERATVAATLRALDGAPVAHLAAHGHHERENVLFSRLDLADGPLMAYDVNQLAAPPPHVTLSACDVGRTVVRAGDEILGFTAALLYAGTSSVVSSVARVTHDAAAAVMTQYHRAVATGTEPARALAAASLVEPLAPFVCFGAG